MLDGVFSARVARSFNCTTTLITTSPLMSAKPNLPHKPFSGSSDEPNRKMKREHSDSSSGLSLEVVWLSSNSSYFFIHLCLENLISVSEVLGYCSALEHVFAEKIIDLMYVRELYMFVRRLRESCPPQEFALYWVGCHPHAQSLMKHPANQFMIFQTGIRH